MSFKFYAFLFLCIINAPIFAQQQEMSGKLSDTAEHKNVSLAAVSILTTDSILVAHTRSNGEGIFQLKLPVAGSYLLWITHPQYADYFKSIPSTTTSKLDLGTLPMITKSQLLQEVVVIQKLGAIRFKKDTTEYIADSFKVAVNANVEDLLKRLPGVQVDKDGKIKAQGEEVKKVLVDGEEFFGNDPTMTTQNIKADAVEKVQVYDKKSDQAAFTGIDDGQKTKTINISLKEDKKNGYFGKLSVGAGFKNKFSEQAMINAFKGKRKFSAFGVMSNIGKTGLDWMDQDSYGSNDNGEMNFEEGSMMMYFRSEGDEFGAGGTYYGEGLPTSWSAGTQYSNKWKADQHHLNFNFRFNKLNTFGGGSTTTQYILPDTFYYQNNSGNTFSQKIRNKLGGMYEFQIDSLTSLKLTTNASLGNTKTDNYNMTASQDAERKLVNRGTTHIYIDGTIQNWDQTVLIRKKFKTKGRTLSVNYNQKYNASNSDGSLQSGNYFYNVAQTIFRSDSIDQKKFNELQKSDLSAKISYTEPLGKKVLLEVNYGIIYEESKAEKSSYDKQGETYTKYVDSLSSQFSLRILSHSLGSSVRWNAKSINITAGGNIYNAAYLQKDIRVDTSYRYRFVNFFPRMNVNWTIKPQSRLSAGYKGRTASPTLDQLQPLRNNTNPLFIQKGNPDLRQSFYHEFNMNYSDFKVLKERSIWFFGNFNKIDNAISNSDQIDSEGRTISQPVNVQGNYNYNAWTSYGMKWKGTDFRFSFPIQVNGSRNMGFVNGEKNITTSQMISVGFDGSYQKERKIDFYFSLNRAYNYSRSSLYYVTSNNYWATNFTGQGKIFLPKKLEWTTGLDINLRQKTPLFVNNNDVYLWKSSIAKKIFKNESGTLKLEANDLLNSNRGFSRDMSSNKITERTYETIRRFWMLSFTWDFSKNNATKTN